MSAIDALSSCLAAFPDPTVLSDLAMIPDRERRVSRGPRRAQSPSSWRNRQVALLVEGSADFIGLTGSDGRARFLNRAGRQLVGLDAQANIHDLTLFDLLAEGDHPQVEQMLGVVRSVGRDERELRARHQASGEAIPVWWNTFSLRDRMTGRTAVAVVGRDMREQKQAVLLRERMLAIVAHDLRAPLMAISVSVAAMTSRGNLGGEDSRAATRMNRSCERMIHLIQQLVDFSGVRSRGSIVLARQNLDLGELTEEVVAEQALSQGSTAVGVERLGTAVGCWDRTRLAQVVSNLVANALQYGGRDHPVRVAVEGRDAEVLLVVHNDGPSIPSDSLPFIFDPFRRAREQGYATGHNLGLGLYITQEIVVAHGGQIGVSSSDVDGTTFTVRLPRAESAAR